VCNPDTIECDTTAAISGLPDFTASLGQGRAEEALRFGLSMHHPGYHVFVLGEHGTGRHAVAFRLIEELAAKGTVPPDLCYLHNFDDPVRPRLLSLPAGRGTTLRTDMQTFIREQPYHTRDSQRHTGYHAHTHPFLPQQHCAQRQSEYRINRHDRRHHADRALQQCRIHHQDSTPVTQTG
jgi:hypothetical protein